MQSTDYIALRNIELNYTFPTSLSDKISAENVTLYVSALNVGFLTDYKGPDPSSISPRFSGQDRFNTIPPAPLSINFGVDITF